MLFVGHVISTLATLGLAHLVAHCSHKDITEALLWTFKRFKTALSFKRFKRPEKRLKRYVKRISKVQISSMFFMQIIQIQSSLFAKPFLQSSST